MRLRITASSDGLGSTEMTWTPPQAPGVIEGRIGKGSRPQNAVRDQSGAAAAYRPRQGVQSAAAAPVGHVAVREAVEPRASEKRNPVERLGTAASFGLREPGHEGRR